MKKEKAAVCVVDKGNFVVTDDTALALVWWGARRKRKVDNVGARRGRGCRPPAVSSGTREKLQPLTENDRDSQPSELDLAGKSGESALTMPCHF